MRFVTVKLGEKALGYRLSEDSQILVTGNVVLMTLLPIAALVHGWKSDTGEMAVMGVASAVCLIILAYRRSGMQTTRRKHINDMVVRAIRRGIE